MTLVAPTDVASRLDLDDIVHIACCEDDTVALCGWDLTGSTWVLDGTGMTCAMCDDCERHDRCAKWKLCDLGDV